MHRSTDETYTNKYNNLSSASQDMKILEFWIAVQ